MKSRRKIKCDTLVVGIALWLLLLVSRINSAKLYPGLKVPSYATIAGGGNAIQTPLIKARQLSPANVGKFDGAGKANIASPPRAPGPAAPGPPAEDGVQREETVEYKEVDGELVSVVSGSYAYESPEGLPVSFMYMADENGNRASFTIGKAAAGGGSGAGGSKPKPSGGGAGGGSGKSGSGGGKNSYLPPDKKGGGGGGGGKSPTTGKDKMYLPPSY